MLITLVLIFKSLMKPLFSYLIFVITSMFPISEVISQNFKNEITISYNYIFFLNYKTFFISDADISSFSFCGSYERNIFPKANLGVALQYAFQGRDPAFHISDPSFMGETTLRNLYNLDLFSTTPFLSNPKKTINSSIGLGISYIWGHEDTSYLFLPSPPASFPHGFLWGWRRHHPGLLFLWEMDFLPNQIFDLESSLKFRIYTKGSPDLSIGLNIGLQFNDPKFGKRDRTLN